MRPRAAANVIVGSGITGLLVARELIRAGEEVTVVERGPVRLDADALPPSAREARLPTTAHNTEPLPAGRDPWQYGYAFGGSSLLWSGVFPRLLPADFELRSRYGIWRDWPLSYADLVPHYREAERLLDATGGPHELFPGSDAYPHPPLDPSPAERALAPLLEPFGPLALARQTAGPGAYPPPAGDPSGGVESSSTVLEIARELLAEPGFSVLDRTAAARLRTSAGTVTAVECVGSDGERTELNARRVVLAAHGIENAALLLRSGLGGPAVGRWLGDHVHVELQFELDRPLPAGPAASRDSRASYAWIDGPWRAERAAAAVIPFNPGLIVRDDLAEALADGRGGGALRRAMAERHARTLVLYVSLEDAPREDRGVELSPRRDELGLPLSRVTYPPDSDYVRRGLEEVREGLTERLRPLGARFTGQRPGNRGGHMLGTCFMGPDGVVDENLRHHRLGNLYVAGGSAFPTHSALHPTATIAALALRLGGHLAEATR